MGLGGPYSVQYSVNAKGATDRSRVWFRTGLDRTRKNGSRTMTGPRQARQTEIETGHDRARWGASVRQGKPGPGRAAGGQRVLQVLYLQMQGGTSRSRV